MPPPQPDTYGAVFDALAHPARRRVLLTIYFNGGSMTAGDIAAIFTHAWQTTTRHLRVLEDAGLLSSQRSGRQRIYRIERRRLDLVTEWLAHFTPHPSSSTRRTIDMTTAAGTDVPTLFRLTVEVGDLGKAVEFYHQLLGVEGRNQAGSRSYFHTGPVTLCVLDVGAVHSPHPAAKSLYFAVGDLNAVFARATALSCLSAELVHGTPGGEIAVRPWGERSFYAQDPWGNPLCFVEDGTVYPG